MKNPTFLCKSKGGLFPCINLNVVTFSCLVPALTGPGIFYGSYMAGDLEFEPATSIKRAAGQSRSFMVRGFKDVAMAMDQISVISLETRAAPREGRGSGTR